MHSLPKILVQKYQNWTTYAFMTFRIILLNLIVHNMPPTNSHVIYIEIIGNSITFPFRPFGNSFVILKKIPQQG